MTSAGLYALAPLAAPALGGLVAMVLAPVARAGVVRGVAAAFLLAAFAVIVLRAGAPVESVGVLVLDDGLARFGAGLALLSGLGALAVSRAEGAVREAPALVALATAGAVALAAAGHGATLFLGLEIMTLAILALTVMPRSGAAIEAAYKLFLLAGAGASALLLGLAFGLAETGGLALSVWSGGGAVAGLGAVLLFVGVAVKFGLVPFHMWVPDLFSGAPMGASALVAAASKVAVAVALVRLSQALAGGGFWTEALAVTGVAAVLLGNIAALTQPGLLRMLGYSAVAHSGYLALILASQTPRTGEAVLVYLAGYAPAAIAALCVAARVGPSPARENLRGLAWRRPLLGAGLLVALLSMAGLPPTLGFMGKAYLFAVLAEAGNFWLLAVAVAGAAVGFAVYMRFAVGIAAFAESGSPISETARTGGDAISGGVVALCIVALLIIGAFPEPLVALAQAAMG